jgi:hypothetical protein
MEEVNKNTGIALVHYTITPALNVEGDEEDTEILKLLANAVITCEAKYTGWTFDDKPERLALNAGADITDVVFTLHVPGLTPFNGEYDFRAGVIAGLQHGSGEITEGSYHENGTVKQIDVLLNQIIE